MITQITFVGCYTNRNKDTQIPITGMCHTCIEIFTLKILRLRFACENICLVNDNGARLLVNNSIWSMCVCVTERERSICGQDRILYSHPLRCNIYRMAYVFYLFTILQLGSLRWRWMCDPWEIRIHRRLDQISFAIKKLFKNKKYVSIYIYTSKSLPYKSFCAYKVIAWQCENCSERVLLLYFIYYIYIYVVCLHGYKDIILCGFFFFYLFIYFILLPLSGHLAGRESFIPIVILWGLLCVREYNIYVMLAR